MVRDNSTKHIWRGRFIRYAPFVLWIGVILFLSSGAGSMVETSRIIRPILKFLFPAASEDTILIYHGYVRKFAHFAEYSILAFLAFRAFSRSSRRFIREYKYLLPFLAVLLIATIDEFFQSFEASRTGAFRDVLLDFSGGVVMVTIIWLINKLLPSATD